MANAYSQQWFDVFGRTVDGAQTQREVDFVRRQLPQPEFNRVLDLCCGTGRHSQLLLKAGYSIVGLDNSAEALASARACAVGGAFLLGDMRDLQTIPMPQDAVVCLWQSFGYFDTPTNSSILSRVSALLRSGGRFILDIYNREFFERNQGVRTFSKCGLQIEESKWLDGTRLKVRLAYPDGTCDNFDWEVFTAEQIENRCAQQGFKCISAVSDFDLSKSPDEHNPRMQFVFQKTV